MCTNIVIRSLANKEMPFRGNCAIFSVPEKVICIAGRLRSFITWKFSFHHDTKRTITYPRWLFRIIHPPRPPLCKSNKTFHKKFKIRKGGKTRLNS